MYTGALLESVEGRLILWLAFTSVMWQGVGSNSWPLYLQSDELATVLSRRACVMIMSDCKSCVLFLSKKKNTHTNKTKKKKKNVRSGWGTCSFHRSLVGYDNLCPPPPPPPPPHTHFKEFGGAYCVCIVRYFVRVFLRGLKHFLGDKDIKNLIYKYLHIYVLSFTPYKTI